MKMRPTRYIGLRYYLLTIICLAIAAIAFYIGPIENYASVSGSGPERPVDVLVAKLSVDETVSVLFLVFALYGFARAEIKRGGRLYEIRGDRVVRTDGFLRKFTQTIPYSHIEEVRIRQGIFNRILNTGTLVVDTGEEDIVFTSIPNVKKAQDLIVERMNSVSHSRRR